MVIICKGHVIESFEVLKDLIKFLMSLKCTLYNMDYETAIVIASLRTSCMG